MTDMVPLDYSSTGLIIGDPITQEDWAERVEWLLGVKIATPVILGDLINYGKENWPDTWEDLLPSWISELQRQTLRNYGSIMLRVPHAVRQAGLGISHYDAVAALPEPDQKELLELAVEGGIMPRNELRDLAAERLGREVPCKVTGTGWLSHATMKQCPRCRFLHSYGVDECSNCSGLLDNAQHVLVWLIEPLQTEGEIQEGEIWLSLRNTA